jgi:hypothetical protein
LWVLYEIISKHYAKNIGKIYNVSGGVMILFLTLLPVATLQNYIQLLALFTNNNYNFADLSNEVTESSLFMLFCKESRTLQ